jgi:hypothetical protein
VDRDDRVGSARLTLPRVVLPTVRVPREDQELNQSSRIATPRRELFDHDGALRPILSASGLNALIQ